MKALILNSGIGKRMGNYTLSAPKCLVKLSEEDTILSRQLNLIQKIGVKEVVITTGSYSNLLEEYVKSLKLPIDIQFINNPNFRSTNYIYSIYLATEVIHSDILLLHGDLVFEEKALEKMILFNKSYMAVSTVLDLPDKDFKAVIMNGKIVKVGVEFFKNAVAAQPLYSIKKDEWEIWLKKINDLCENGDINCYAEKALNLIMCKINLYPMDIGKLLCQEIDKEDDLLQVKKKLR